MPVVAKHVKARACRRQQHRIAFARGALRRRNRLRHVARSLERYPGGLQGPLDAARITPDKNDGTCVLCDYGRKRSEVLSFALTSRDQDDRSTDSRESRRSGRRRRALQYAAVFKLQGACPWAVRALNPRATASWQL